MEELIKGGAPAPRQKMTMPYIAGGVVTLLFALALYLVFGVVLSIQSEQKQSAIRGYKNRAVICDMQKALGIRESRECGDPAIQPYRDPNAAQGSTAGARNSRATMVVVCALATKLDVRVPECSGT